MAERKVIEEQVGTRSIESFMHLYRDPQQAFMELIDNAVDNRKPDSTLTVDIRVSKNELVVSNYGGKGLDFDGLSKFFVWGHSEKTDQEIGYYGVGGKAAMGYLGKSLEVSCSADGEHEEYRIADPSWETREHGEWKIFEVEESETEDDKGSFRVRITNLKKRIDARALHAKLADIYRPLLFTRHVVMNINGTEIQPLDIQYEDEEGLEMQDYSVPTRYGRDFPLRVGVLKEGQKVKPGVRLYYRGRLIEDGQFFGKITPAEMPQASRLIGETFLDFVPVTTNKSDFDKGSLQWAEAARGIAAALVPWESKLASIKIEKTNSIEDWEMKSAQHARRLLADVLANFDEVDRLLIRSNNPDISVSPPNSNNPETKTPEGNPRKRIGGEDKNVDRKKHRPNSIADFEIVSMNLPTLRSQIVEQDGSRILRINSDANFYQAQKQAGGEALSLYIGETAVFAVTQDFFKEGTADEFIEVYNALLANWGEAYQKRIKFKL